MDDIQAFLDYLTIEKRSSAHTINNYRRDLSVFEAFRENQLHNKPYPELTSHDCRAFVAHQHRQGLSGKSIARRLSACRGFFNHLIKHGKLRFNPAEDITAPKTAKKLPNVLPADTAGHLLNQTPETPADIRDHAILELLYSTGMRVSELVSLNIANVTPISDELRVTGKGNKERNVMVGSKAQDAVKQWLNVRSQWLKHDSEPALFLNQRGGRLSTRGVQLRLQHYGLTHDLGRNLHPHMLRHSFATHLLESSSELRPVQELLGHANISTTQIYTHLDFQKLAETYESAHPRAQKKSDS